MSPKLLVFATFALVGCASPIPRGYVVRLHDGGPYHPPANYYLFLGPDESHPSRRPIRDESVIEGIWAAVAQKKCGHQQVRVTYGPYLTSTLPEYCSRYAEEPDCGPSASGYFYCVQ